MATSSNLPQSKWLEQEQGVRLDEQLVRLALRDAEPQIASEAAASEIEVQLRADQAAEQYSGYKSLVDRAAEVFGDDLKASRWLSLPSADLSGKVPLQVAQSVEYSHSKLQEIFEPIFIRIEHGIYT